MFRRLMLMLAIGTALMLSGCGSESGASGPSPTPLPGTVLDPPKALRDFTLTSHTGDALSLGDLRGKTVLIFFGFTHCPDVCPTTMADFKRVKAELGADAEQVAFVFISVDGERDTPDRLASYLHAFDPDFIGLTGADAEIRAVAEDFGVFYQRVDEGHADHYMVDHTASSFVVGADGTLRIVFSYQSDPAGMAARIRGLMGES